MARVMLERECVARKTPPGLGVARLQDRRGLVTNVGMLLLVLSAVGLWGVSLPAVDVRRIGDVGLITALPPAMLFSFAILTASFCVSLFARPRTEAMPLLPILALVIMLFGITPLTQEVPRFHVAWRHVGIADYILRQGMVDPRIDAYFNWPSFFILTAFATQIVGVQSLLPVVAWAPVVLNLLYLGPLLVICRSATRDPRLVWSAAWFFYLANWVGQDYFSPQGLNYFLYLVIVAVLIRWFQFRPDAVDALPLWLRPLQSLAPSLARLGVWLAPTDAPPAPSWPGQRAGLMAITVVLFASVVPSHQLTPFAILLGITALVMTGRCTASGLPVLMAVLIAVWLSYMASTFLAGHLRGLVDEVGNVNSAVSSGVGQRLQGNSGHLFIVRLRIGLTLLVWGLAFLGGLRRFRAGHRDIAVAVLAAAPFTLLALQAYGGEMLLRVYFFALPFVAFFLAAVFFPEPSRGRSWWTLATLSLMSGVLLVGVLFARFGNERMDYFTTREVEAVRYIYAVARPGARLLSVGVSIPWQDQYYATHQYGGLSSGIVERADAAAVAELMRRGDSSNTYLIITRSAKAEADLFQGLGPDAVDRLEAALRASGSFDILLANEDATVYVLRGPG